MDFYVIKCFMFVLFKKNAFVIETIRKKYRKMISHFNINKQEIIFSFLKRILKLLATETVTLSVVFTVKQKMFIYLNMGTTKMTVNYSHATRTSQ